MRPRTAIRLRRRLGLPTTSVGAGENVRPWRLGAKPGSAQIVRRRRKAVAKLRRAGYL